MSTEQTAALDALRAALATEFKSPDLAGSTTIWGADLAGEPTPKANAVLLKFLRAREFKVDDAKTMVLSTLKWRKEFGMDALKSETFSAAFNELGVIYGKDKNGKPVTYNFYGSIGQSMIYDNPDLFLRWRIQLMEKAIELLDFESGLETVTQVHDYTGASLFLDPRIKAVSKKIIAIFQDHYPELLERKFFVGVPAVMEYLFALFTSFVSAKTKAKFAVVSKTNTRAALLEYIAPDQLPPRYGGFAAAADAPEDIVSVVVAARKDCVVEIPVAAGETAAWDWAVVNLDIGFSALLENKAGEEAKGKRVGGEPGRGEGGSGQVVAEEDAVLKVRFDNTYSMVTEKSVLYRVWVKKN